MDSNSDSDSDSDSETEIDYTPPTKTVHPTIIWDLTDQTTHYIQYTLQRKYAKYLDNESYQTYVFTNLPEKIFDALYQITLDESIKHKILPGVWGTDDWPPTFFEPSPVP